MIRPLLACACTLACLGAAEWRFVPPEGSGMVNVKDYGAVGDGVADDTAAIAKAIAENIDVSRYRANPMVFFPNGTYKVTGPVEGRKGTTGWSAGWRSMMILIGETRSGAVIKLADRADGYGDPAKPKWVVACGSESEGDKNHSGGGNRAFRHGVLNLTIDVGSGNPGAIGLDFIASNRGGVDGVTIRAPADSGHTGIAMTRNWPGPAMICDVTIDGFARGMELRHYQYGMTFEHLRMRNQREVGVLNAQNVVAMRKVDFEGSVPFYRSSPQHGMLCLLDSTLKGTGDAAILSGGFVNLRRVTVDGYAKVIDDTSKADKDLPAEAGKPMVVTAHDQGFALDGAGRTPTWLDLPIEEAPVIRPPVGAAFVDGGDTGETVQAAIDAGAEYIYLKPRSSIPLSQPLVLRNKVKLIMGLAGCLAMKKDAADRVAVRVEDGAAPVVVFDQVFVDGIIEHPSKRTFVLRHGDHGGYRATGPGKSHILDVIGKGYEIGPQHRLWARQLNAEFGDDPLLTNAGTTWVLGFKMESSTAGGGKDGKSQSQGTPSIRNKDGGSFEMYGGLLYTLGSKKEHAPRQPAFTNEKGRMALSYRTNGIPATYYDVILRRGGWEQGDDLHAAAIKGPGAALLSDER